MDGITALVVAIGGAGGFVGLSQLVKVFIEWRQGVRGLDDDAEERMIARLEKRITQLEDHVTRLEAHRDADAHYIAELLEFIALQKPPPPPLRRTT